jgi:hypothetical protein
MNREERERMVDRLLDGALTAQNAEPREGLEERILANLRTQPERHPWRRWLWAPALAAAAILIAAGLHLARRTPAPATPQVTRRQPPANVRRDAEAQRQVATVQPHHVPRSGSRRVPRPSPVLARAGKLPRQDVFPSPAPLTPEEQLLLALVRDNRPEAVNLAQAQQSERERVQKYFETGEAPVAVPAAAPMR